jgi:phospholipid-binding lipoprotein MlaA
MQNYLLIVLRCVIVAALIMTAGCAKSAKRNAQSPTILQKDVNSPDDAEFGEFEEEMSGKEIHIADPLESFNRTMFGFNDVLYFWVVKPVTKTYSNVVPKPGRIGISNFFRNITTPIRLANCLLQGKTKAASREVDRFAINTTVGILGVGDPAADKYKISPADEDLGQTLAVYGLGNGCYLVLPFFGPSTLRDTGGMVGDMFLNPIFYVEPRELAMGISAWHFTNQGSFRIGEYESIKEASMDPYVAIRDIYIQNRDKKIKE